MSTQQVGKRVWPLTLQRWYGGWDGKERAFGFRYSKWSGVHAFQVYAWRWFVDWRTYVKQQPPPLEYRFPAPASAPEITVTTGELAQARVRWTDHDEQAVLAGEISAALRDLDRVFRAVFPHVTPNCSVVRIYKQFYIDLSVEVRPFGRLASTEFVEAAAKLRWQCAGAPL